MNVDQPDAAVRVRRAQSEDGPTLLRLIDALAEYEHLTPPDLEARRRLMEDGFGPRPRFVALLAEVASQPVGYAVIFETYSTFLARPTLFLEDIFVLPSHRRAGAGRALFLHCLSLALERGCGRMEWQVLDWNALALGFYERLGARRLREWLPFRLIPEEARHLLAMESTAAASNPAAD